MNIDNILACPSCGKSTISAGEFNYMCESCKTDYQISNGVPVLLKPESKINAEEADRANFWNDGWEKRNSHLLEMDRDAILHERQRYLEYLIKSGYPSVVDISEDNVAGKTFLNIGCGGGYEGLLFAGYGTQYIGVDFTNNAASFTKVFIDKAEFDGTTFQAEAETLPFQSDSIDYIYSSGVLHHTPNTEAALAEAYRVLKPGGTAMIGLYATYSVMFIWYRLHALIRGNITKKAIDDWMHANTEGDWQTENRENHWTKTYTKDQFSEMLDRAGFSREKMVQCPLQLKIVPIIGKIVTKIFPTWVGDLRIGPMGGMLLATCTKK